MVQIVKKHYILSSLLFFSSLHVEHFLHTQFSWSSYNTKYILNLPPPHLSSYLKAPLKFCQSKQFVGGSHFYIYLQEFYIYIMVILESLIFEVDKEIHRLSQDIFLTQLNHFFREKEVPL